MITPAREARLDEVYRLVKGAGDEGLSVAEAREQMGGFSDRYVRDLLYMLCELKYVRAADSLERTKVKLTTVVRFYLRADEHHG